MTGSRPVPSIERLLGIMRALRDPVAGCPWDIEQTFESISRYTLEEAYEVADAISRKDPDDLKGELGDLLLQVVFHAQIASDQKLFNFSDVVSAICEKMMRRHPHVFGTETQVDHLARSKSWEADKKRERVAKSMPSALDGVAGTLPALVRAVKLANRAATVGFDWKQSDHVWAKISEEMDEFREAVDMGDPDRMEDELGDILFVVANLARHHGVDPEAALQRTNAKFVRRFQGIESRVVSSGKRMEDLNLDELESHWSEIKRLEKQTPK